MGRNRKEQLSEEVHLQPQVVQDQKTTSFFRTYLRHRQFKIKNADVPYYHRWYIYPESYRSHHQLLFLAFSLVTYPSPCCVTMLLMNPFFRFEVITHGLRLVRCFLRLLNIGVPCSTPVVSATPRAYTVLLSIFIVINSEVNSMFW